MAVVIAVHAAITAIGVRILVASTAIEGLQCNVEYFQQRFRRAHQFLEIAGTTRHAVVDHQITTRRI